MSSNEKVRRYTNLAQYDCRYAYRGKKERDLMWNYE